MLQFGQMNVLSTIVRCLVELGASTLFENTFHKSENVFSFAPKIVPKIISQSQITDKNDRSVHNVSMTP